MGALFNFLSSGAPCLLVVFSTRCSLVSQFLSGKLLCGRKRSTTSRNTAERRAPPAVHFLLFETLSEVRKLTTFYLAKNDHRWVTFISLKTMSVHFLSFSIFSNK